MALPFEETEKKSLWEHLALTGILYIAAWVLAIWFIEVADTFLLGERLQKQGIQPRSVDGLDGILWAPFLHSDFGHTLSNTAPFAVLGGLVAIRGKRHWFRVTVASIIVGGALTWAFARSGNHIGSSGVVFGYLGALVGSAAFERRMAHFATAVIAIFFYGSIFVGLIPQNEISWEGHLAGFVTGAGVSFWLARTMPRPSKALDEPDDELSLLLGNPELLADPE